MWLIFFAQEMISENNGQVKIPYNRTFTFPQNLNFQPLEIVSR